MRERGKTYLQWLSSVAAMSLTAWIGTAHAETAQFTIPAQRLDRALEAFGQQSGHPLLVDMSLVKTKTSPGIVAAADPETALRKLLIGTGLSYRRNGDIFSITMARNDAPVRAAPQPALAAETVSGSAVEGLVVTAQKKRENIQDVPIAISAFSADTLQAQKIEGGFDLLKAIPNVTFSKNNFTSYNFSIRGIGTKAVSATTDPGVAVSFNNIGLIQNRLFEQEYFDVERVEVLRGPQGTLYGRNATAGVINLISNKPDLGAFDGSLKGEVGNYHTKRLSGFINVPLIEDVLAVRFSGALTDRQGYDYNSVTKNEVNGRDLWSARLSIGFEPTDSIRADFIWERFNEDDNRSRTGKQLCHRDNGPEMIGETPTKISDSPFGSLLVPSMFATGCKAGSLYDDAAFGTPNGLALPFVFGMLVLGANEPGRFALYPLGFQKGWTGNVNPAPTTLVQLQDPYGGLMQSRDLRTIASFKDPIYRAYADLFELNIDFEVAPGLTLYSQTAYDKDTVYSFQDFNRFNTVPIFTDTSQLASDFSCNFTSEGQVCASGDDPSYWAALAPGGIFCDPQLGCSNTLAGFDISQAKARQFTQELRLQSSFDGPLNFSVGANYTRFQALVDYYVMYNLISAFALMLPFNGGSANPGPDPNKCWGNLTDGFFVTTDINAPNAICPYIDPNPVESINGEGHNYFRSKNPYTLKSAAAFGELYWQFADDLKLTAGLRYTDDKKIFIPVPSQVLLAQGFILGGAVNRGYPAKPAIEQHWGEWTGRLGIDWQPNLSFTDETLLYAFYSRGYKGGGANPPSPGFASPEETAAQYGLDQATVDLYKSMDLLPVLKLTGVEYDATFEPEFVNAFEIGSKNTLLGGGMTFNTTAFYYDYKDYQVSQIRDRTAVNENFDAKVWGLEFETMFAPSQDLQIIANLGYLDTSIADGMKSIDIMNRTQGSPDWVVAKPWAQLPSNCVVPAHVAEAWLQYENRTYITLCGGVGGLLKALADPFPLIDPATGERYNIANYPEANGGAGLFADLSGNELPNSPHWTANLGVQYGWDILDGWRATVRGDTYWQSQSWARVYNLDSYDKLHGWYNANLSMWIEKPEEDLKIEFYVKNVLDDTPITDAFLNSDDTALTTNVFTLDPRLIGLQITKGF